MILKTKIPNRVVQKKVKKIGGGWKVKVWFKFDDNGLAEIDETQLTKTDIIKLKSLFEVVDTLKEHKTDGKLNLFEMSYQELKSLASEKGINTYKKGKRELIKELGGKHV